MGKRSVVVIVAVLALLLGAGAGLLLWRGSGEQESDLVPSGAMWRYDDTGKDLGTTWREPGFDDSSWPLGQAPLGYGQAVTTTISSGPDPAKKHLTAYFRTTFEAGAGVAGLELGIRRDDGAVVYLNGTELFRTGIPKGSVTATTQAQYAPDDGSAWVRATLPATDLVEGSNVIAVEVHQSAPDSSDLIFDLQLTATDEAPAAATQRPVPPGAVRVYAAGDIGECGGAASETAEIVESGKEPFWALGDIAYPEGSTQDYKECYDPAYGPLLDRTRPVPGNHDYMQPDAKPYFDYFGGRAGSPEQSWYSEDLGDWHVVHLNSNCDAIGGCGPDSPQVRWLVEDLANTSAKCIAATWHHPRYSSSKYGDDEQVAPLYQALLDAGGDIVLNGHAHLYERFAKTDNDNQRSDTGVREFTVGTGGAGLYEFGTINPNSEVRWNQGHGVLQLDLKPDGYDWVFIPTEPGVAVDSGSDTC